MEEVHGLTKFEHFKQTSWNSNVRNACIRLDLKVNNVSVDMLRCRKCWNVARNLCNW